MQAIKINLNDAEWNDKTRLTLISELSREALNGFKSHPPQVLFDVMERIFFLSNAKDFWLENNRERILNGGLDQWCL